MSSLETRHYVATLEDVAAITRDVIAAQKSGQQSRNTYLSALIATTQKELGERPRLRSASPAKLSEEERIEQLAALEKVGKRFGEAVEKAAKELIEGPDRGGRELNRRTTFARTNLSAIRRWVKAGNDITSLVAGRTTKAALATPGRRKGPSVKVLGNQTQRYAASLEKTLKTFVEADREAAEAQWARVKAAMERIFRRNAGVPRRATRHETRAGA